MRNAGVEIEILIEYTTLFEKENQQLKREKNYWKSKEKSY